MQTNFLISIPARLERFSSSEMTSVTMMTVSRGSNIAMSLNLSFSTHSSPINVMLPHLSSILSNSLHTELPDLILRLLPLTVPGPPLQSLAELQRVDPRLHLFPETFHLQLHVVLDVLQVVEVVPGLGPELGQQVPLGHHWSCRHLQLGVAPPWLSSCRSSCWRGAPPGCC